MSIGCFSSGYLAVDFFFALSGLVIDDAYGERLRARNLTWTGFARMRLIRLYPMMAAGMAIGIVVLLAAYHLHEPQVVHDLPVLLASIACNLLILPTPLMAQLFPANVVQWSLFFELLANGLYAAFIRRLNPLAVIAVSGAVLIFGVSRHGNIQLGCVWGTLVFGLARLAFSFSVGVFLARLKLRTYRCPMILSLLPVAVLIAILAAPVQPPARPFYDGIAVMVVFPLIIVAAISWDFTKHGNREAGFLGDISYPLYAVHFPILQMFYNMTKHCHFHAWAVAAAYVPAMIVFAWLLARFYDAPVRAFLTRAARAKNGGAAIPGRGAGFVSR